MKKYCFTLAIAITALTMVSGLNAQVKKPTELPNISLIGSILGTSTAQKKTFSVSEIELTFQHYLYPSVKADVFLALHKNAKGERVLELEEGYVTFLDLVEVLFPGTDYNLGLGAIAGKKLLSVGKVNPLHPEQWAFVDRPLAVQKFLGGEEGLSAEGAQLSYLLPLPIFSQVEVGYWSANAAHEGHGEHGEEASHGVEYENRILNGRLWNSVSLSDSQEVELGFNYLLGNASSKEQDDQSQVMGADMSFSQELGSNQSLKLQTEFYEATYGEDGESREKQTGGFVSAFYKLSKDYQAGVRYGVLGKHGDDGEETNQWSVMATRQLTETSKFKLQYNFGEDVDKTVYAKFIFGMGPHAHVLQ